MNKYCISLMFIVGAIYSYHSFAYENNSVILKGSIVVDVRKKSLEKRDLLICHGIIVDEISPNCDPKIEDVSGKWRIPGLNDMHVHARGQLLGDDGSLLERIPQVLMPLINLLTI